MAQQCDDSGVGDVSSSQYPSDDIPRRKASELQLMAAAHDCNAQVVALKCEGRFTSAFPSAGCSGNSAAHDVMQSLSAPWRKSAPASSGTP